MLIQNIRHTVRRWDGIPFQQQRVAVRVARVDPLSALMQGGRGVTASSTRSVVRQGLVVTQMALATTLLVGAALLLQSFVRLQNVPLGFEAERVLTARVGLSRTAYPADGGDRTRMAVGATRREIVAMILRGGMSWTAAGIALGSTGALFVNEIPATLLFEVRPNDSFTLVSIAMLLAAVALIACYVPARRAARVDPLAALRWE